MVFISRFIYVLIGWEEIPTCVQSSLLINFIISDLLQAVVISTRP